MISELSTSGSTPALELALRFAAQRQRLIAHNIANISTPDYVQQDVSVKDFQRVLGDAIQQRRARTGGAFGELPWQETRELKRAASDQGLALSPQSPGAGILFHDRNNRDLETLMRDNVENATFYRVTTDLLRQNYAMIRSAIAERVG